MKHPEPNPFDSSSVNAQASECGYDAGTAATASVPPQLAETIPMSDVPTDNLLQFGEQLAAISIQHLSPGTRLKLAGNVLSVNAYPDESGGFVYVGTPVYQVPSEPDLAEVFALAGHANIAWLRFDSEAGIVEGLPLYDDEDDGEALP